MSWANLDDRLHAHPKVRELQTVPFLGAEAFGIWCWCLSWCRAFSPNDGRVKVEYAAREWQADPLHMAEVFDLLVTVGLVDRDRRGGLRIHDWADWQLSQQAKAGMARAATAKRVHGRFAPADQRAGKAGHQPATPLHASPLHASPAGASEFQTKLAAAGGKKP
ncbi:MAG: hypothetical protein MUD06_10775 [Rhodospirillales bacterium]|jgi:hypothetical protein|nr:hypothetical protein [Rhodospirillales bacterium]